MRFLRRLFQSSPTRAKWPSLIATITRDLTEVRHAWFKICLDNLPDPRDIAGEPLTNPNLVRQSFRAEVSFQLLEASDQLQTQRYLPDEDGREFAALLAATVCGPDMDACMSYVDMLLHAEGGQRLIHVASDIATSIAGHIDIQISTPIAFELVGLGLLSRHVIARAFRDSRSMRRLEATMKQLKEARS